MVSVPRGRNAHLADRVEAWEWEAPRPLPEPLEAPSNEPEDNKTPFELDVHWMRGGFRGSLFAGSSSESERFLDNLIATGLVVLPEATVSGHPIDQSGLLRLLACYNGHPLESLRKKLQWDLNSFYLIIDYLIDRELIFRLPFLPKNGRPDLYYFCDTGVLHRLFNPKWKLSGKGRPYFASSWEGFVIRTIWKRFGEGAEAFVWRQSERDEIDLVLRWPDLADCWAVEIGMGDNKTPSVGFWRGIDFVGAQRLLVIHRGLRDTIGECERMTLEQLLSEK